MKKHFKLYLFLFCMALICMFSAKSIAHAEEKKETETKIIPMKNQQFNFVYDEVFGIDNPLVLKDVDKKIAEIHLGSPQFVCKIIRTNTNIQVCNHSIIYPNTIWALIDFIRLQWGRELVMETLPIK